MVCSMLPDPRSFQSFMKEEYISNNAQDKGEFGDISRLLSLQSQFRNFKTHLQHHRLETKTKATGNALPTTKVSMATHSVYDLSGINNWTPEDDEAKKREEQGLAPEKKPDPFAFYNLSRFPITVIGDAKDNEANRKLMLAELEKLLKKELQRLVNDATEYFTQMLNCTRCERAHLRCMTHPITTMLVKLQIEMRQMDPMKVTQPMVDCWMKTFENVKYAYWVEHKESEGVCDKLVDVHREPKETWV